MNATNARQLKKHIKYIALFLAIVLFLGIGLFIATKKLSAQVPLYFMPNFPTRIMYLASALDDISQESIKLNEQLTDLVSECNCQFTESLCKQIVTSGQPTACVPIKSFGKPCSLVISGEETDITIAGINQKINLAVMDISYFYKLLIAEKEAGLEKQLETLRKDPAAGIDDAQELREAIDKILNAVPDILSNMRSNLELPEQCSAINCTAKCGQGNSSDLSACISVSAAGKQKPTEITFGAKVSIGDEWKLGRIGINKINFNLPKEINIPELSELIMPSFTISIPEITLECPTQSQEIVFQTLKPPLPKPPTLKLSCPEYKSYSDYQCSEGIHPGDERYRDFEWYLEVFSWLSEICVETIGGEDIMKKLQENQEKYKESLRACLDPSKVANKLVQECNEQFAQWQPWPLPPKGIPPSDPICTYLVMEQPNEREGRAREHCFKFFGWLDQTTKNEIVAYLEVKYGINITNIPRDVCTKQKDFNIIPNSFVTLRDSCDKYRDIKTDINPEDMPDQCKILAIFRSLLFFDPPYQIADADILEMIVQSQTCLKQEMSDFPATPISGCSIGAPSIPKIPLSKYSIIIPDIKLPTFKIWPLFNIDLPSFIFEDLTFEDIELCNLDDCQFKFPNLYFEAPTLKIPTINVPPIKLDDIPGIPNILGNPNIEVSIEPIEFGSLNFDFSQFINLSSLVSPELELPQLSLPKPKLDFSFKGVEIDFLDLLLGLFKIPSYSACYSVSMPSAPIIDISYPDYIFSWPAFPRIPEISYCATAREFCKNAKDSIQEIVNQADEIQKVVNDAVKAGIQTKLDAVEGIIQTKIESALQGALDDISKTIKSAINAHLAFHLPKTVTLPPAPMPGVFPIGGGLSCEGIPPLTIPSSVIPNIDIGEIKLSDYVSLPDTIIIPWPSGLKQISLPGDGLSYDLPTIPLSNLAYSKDITINLPGFQGLSLSTDFDWSLGNATDCISKPPTGNACGSAVSDMDDKINEMKNIAAQFQEASQKIKNVLE